MSHKLVRMFESVDKIIMKANEQYFPVESCFLWLPLFSMWTKHLDLCHATGFLPGVLRDLDLDAVIYLFFSAEYN